MGDKKADRVEKVFEELKGKGLISEKRHLKKKNIRNFRARFILNRIYYDPVFTSLDEKSIRFILLHEEGHLRLKQKKRPSKTDEYEADFWAAEQMIIFYGDREPHKTLEMALEKADGMRKKRKSRIWKRKADSHPSTEERRNYVKRRLEKSEVRTWNIS